MSENSVTETGFECRITIVSPGKSDSVLKVFPAEHESEKIWLDNKPGKERWEMIKRSMQLHASRFAPIANPVPYHTDNSDLGAITLKEKDIPVVKLENFVLPAPPKEKVAPQVAEASGKEWSERIDKLENTVNKLADIITAQAGNPASPVITNNTDTPVKRGPGRPKTK